MADADVPPPLPSQAPARTWAAHAAWAACAVAIAWPARWFKYDLPGHSPVAVVGAAFFVLFFLRTRTGLRSAWLAFLGGAFAFGLCVAVRPWCDPDFLEGHLWCRFRADVWRDVRGTGSEARISMIDDYLASHPPVGRSLEEIDALLGPDDLDGREHLGTREWWLGPERGFIRIDSETLVVEADEQGTVTKAYIYRD